MLSSVYVMLCLSYVKFSFLHFQIIHAYYLVNKKDRWDSGKPRPPA